MRSWQRRKRALTQNGVAPSRAAAFLLSDRRSFVSKANLGTLFSDTLLGFALLGCPAIVARISFVRLSKSANKA
jgi:hypothetical protein